MVTPVFGVLSRERPHESRGDCRIDLNDGDAIKGSKSCMSKTEARQHFGLAHIYWHGVDHCWDASPGHQQRHVVHKVAQKPDQPKWRDATTQWCPT